MDQERKKIGIRAKISTNNNKTDIITLDSKVLQFQPSNLLMSSAYSIILRIQTDYAIKPLKCMFVSFECYKLLIAVIAVIGGFDTNKANR